MLLWNRWNQESAGRLYFNISREKPAHTTDTPHGQPLPCELEWPNQKHFYSFFAETNKRQTCSRVPQSSRSLSSSCTKELWGRDWITTCLPDVPSAVAVPLKWREVNKREIFGRFPNNVNFGTRYFSSGEVYTKYKLLIYQENYWENKFSS